MFRGSRTAVQNWTIVQMSVISDAEVMLIARVPPPYKQSGGVERCAAAACFRASRLVDVVESGTARHEQAYFAILGRFV